MYVLEGHLGGRGKDSMKEAMEIWGLGQISLLCMKWEAEEEQIKGKLKTMKTDVEGRCRGRGAFHASVTTLLSTNVWINNLHTVILLQISLSGNVVDTFLHELTVTVTSPENCSSTPSQTCKNPETLFSICLAAGPQFYT